MIIGIIAGVVCYYAVELKNKLQWDDALDVWGVHGVGGFLGIVLLGLFADQRFNPSGSNGLLLWRFQLLLQTTRRGAFFVGVGVYFHVWDVEGDRSIHARESG